MHAPPLLDVLMPGYRAVRHELVFAPSPELEQWTLVASGELGIGPENAIVVPGVPLTFSSKYRTRFYAARKDEVIPGHLSDEWRAGHASSLPPVAEIHSVPYLSPIESVLTTVRVARIDEHALVLAVAHEETTYAFPQLALWVGVATLLVAGLVGLFLLRRRQRAKSEAACSRC